MSKENLLSGRAGEEEAVAFLKKNGYRIIERNFRTRLGEIDIIAKEKNIFCFIEVKKRSSSDFGLPQEAVDFKKQRQISKAALLYLKEKKLLYQPARFDVVSVLSDSEAVKITLIKNAFELNASYTY